MPANRVGRRGRQLGHLEGGAESDRRAGPATGTALGACGGERAKRRIRPGRCRQLPLRCSQLGAWGGTEEGQRREGGGGRHRGLRGGDATLADGRSCARPASGRLGVRRVCGAGSRLSPAAATPASLGVPTPVPSPRGSLRAPSRAPAPFSLSCVPLPPTLSPASRSLAGALGCSERRRRDSWVPGLPAPAAREQQAPRIYLQTADWTAQCRGGSPPGTAWLHLPHLFLLSGHWPEEGLTHLCAVRWCGASP